MNSPLLTIIHEDADLLIVHKPAGLVCHPTKGDEYSSLISRARIYLRDQSATTPNLQSSTLNLKPHLIHRLDRETSGLVVIAKNPVAARKLGRIWESREVRKEYLAIVHGHVPVEQGIIDAPLGKDIQSRIAIKDCVRPDGAAAQTEFQVEKRFFHIGGTSSTSPQNITITNDKAGECRKTFVYSNAQLDPQNPDPSAPGRQTPDARRQTPTLPILPPSCFAPFRPETPDSHPLITFRP